MYNIFHAVQAHHVFHAVQVQLGLHQFHQDQAVTDIVPVFVKELYTIQINHHHQPPHQPPHQQFVHGAFHQFHQFHQFAEIVQELFILFAHIYTIPHALHHHQPPHQDTHTHHHQAQPHHQLQDDFNVVQVEFHSKIKSGFIFCTVQFAVKAFQVFNAVHIFVVSCDAVHQAHHAHHVYHHATLLPQVHHVAQALQVCVFHIAVAADQADQLPVDHVAQLAQARLQYIVQVANAVHQSHLVLPLQLLQFTQFLDIVQLLVNNHFTKILYHHVFKVTQLFTVRLL